MLLISSVDIQGLYLSRIKVTSHPYIIYVMTEVLMSNKFKFTTATLNALTAQAVSAKSTEVEYSDTEVVGLKCLSGKSGSKRFLLRYRFETQKKAIAIGRFPDVDLTTARKIARQYKTDIALGNDPKARRDKEQSFPTVSEFFTQTYMPLAKRRKSTWKADQTRFRLHCQSIANIRYNKLTANDILRIQLCMSDNDTGQIYKPATCNRVLALLKTVGKLVDSLFDIPNVAIRVSLLPENNARTRYCNIQECQRIIIAARNYRCPYVGSFVALLFLMGCRESELRERVWSDVDWGRKMLMIPKTKNGTTHSIYLSDLMLEILQSIPLQAGNPHIFAGRAAGRPIYRPSKGFALIKTAAGISNPEEVVLHTARHSVASNLISNGTDISAVQRLLNHRSIESTLRYAKLSEAKQRETTQYLSTMISDSSTKKPTFN